MNVEKKDCWDLNDIQTALQATYGLTLLHNVIEDSVGEAVLSLLKALVAPEPDPAAIASAYSRAFRELAVAVNVEAAPRLPDAWQAHLIGLSEVIDNNISRCREEGLLGEEEEQTAVT